MCDAEGGEGYSSGTSWSCYLCTRGDASLKRDPFFYSGMGVASSDSRTSAMHKKPIFVSESARLKLFKFDTFKNLTV